MTIADSSLLLFQVGPVPCCVDSNTAQIVIEPPAHITAIPGSNAYRPGLMVYAKRTVSIYDVRTKFNLSTEQRGKIIITEMGNQLFGFWVDKIQAVLLSSEGKWQILPTECPKELFEAVFMYNKQLIFKTSFNALTKAQVNTHTQRFINKLLNEEQKSKKQNNEETVSIKDTAQPGTQIETKTEAKLETAEDTPLKQNKPVSTKPAVSPLPKLKTHLKTSGSTKTPAAEKQEETIKTKHFSSKSTTSSMSKQSTQAFINKTKKHDSLHASKPVANVSTAVTRHSLSSTKKQAVAETPRIKTIITPSTSRAIEKKEPFVASRPVKSNFNTPIANKASSETQPDNQDISNKTEQQSGIFGILLLLALVIGVPVLSWYLFFDSSSTNITQSRQSNKSRLVLKEKAVQINKQDTASTPLIETDATKTDTEKQTTTENTLSTSDSTTNELNDSPAFEEKTSIEENIESAKISTTDDTITITINDFDAEFNKETLKKEESQSILQPQSEPVQENKKPEAIENITAGDSLPDTDEKPLPLSMQLESSDSQTTDQSRSSPSISTNRIVHIIVRGDTLWHIAKRYIHDPYKYPQLARLSKIKNPDLIYPGNKVIIIIKNHKSD